MRAIFSELNSSFPKFLYKTSEEVPRPSRAEANVAQSPRYPCPAKRSADSGNEIAQ